MKNFSELDKWDDEGNILPFEETITEEDNVFFDNGISANFTDGQKLLLRFGFSKLTQKQKEVIEKIYFKGKSDTEIAEELHITRVAVTKHHQLALKKLRKICLGNN